MSPEDLRELRRIAEQLTGAPVLGISAARSGANSHVFRVETAKRDFALKRYPARSSDLRSRALIEWDALTFLCANGLTAVPCPVARDPEGQYLLMDWIDGTPVTTRNNGEIDGAARFIAEVFRLSALPKAKSFPLASEACLSAYEIGRQIDQRVGALTSVAEIQSFISEAISPVLEACRNKLAVEMSEDRSLDVNLRRLIPADFGFHNALRRPEGSLCYIDFDYFGWDDPVKLTADFILHPGMSLSDAERRRFVAHVAKALPDDPDFEARLRRHLDLYAVRWALILLNPFRADRQSELPTERAARIALSADRRDKAKRLLALAASMV